MLIDMPPALQADTTRLLTDAGFRVVTSAANFQELRSFAPRVVLLNLAPASLFCCDLLSSIRANEATKEIRVIALVKGEAESRARALDLGANVAVPESVHPSELLAQVRAQLREAEQLDRVERELERVVAHEHELQDQVRETAPLKRLLLPALVVAGALLIISAVVFSAVSISNRSQSKQVRNSLATLQRSVLEQQQSLSQVQNEREKLQTSYNKALEEQSRITAERDQLAKQVSSSGGSSALIQQLQDAEKRLQKLEVESNAGRRIVEQYAPSVALLHVVVAFQHIESGKMVTIGKGDSGDDPKNVTLELDGGGPEFLLDSFGTAFVAGKDGLLLTNHHVAEPWWQDEEIKPLLDRGVKPVIKTMEAYFPELTTPLSASTAQVSQEADLSTIKVANLPASLRTLPLAGNTEKAGGGDAIILIGYPTALAAILARVDEKTAAELMNTVRDSDSLLHELAKRKLIRPLSTQGHIGDVRPDRLVYDAQTTSGGSGGPVIDLNGKVVGVNFAILNGFAGASFAVPAGNARVLISKKR
jgi:S1-C subfamily serine protease/DNA-binding NarL/FixJ family response regulator